MISQRPYGGFSAFRLGCRNGHQLFERNQGVFARHFANSAALFSNVSYLTDMGGDCAITRPSQQGYCDQPSLRWQQGEICVTEARPSEQNGSPDLVLGRRLSNGTTAAKNGV
jgi:hypothetical protein